MILTHNNAYKVVEAIKDSISNVVRAIVSVSTIQYRDDKPALNVFIYGINGSMLTIFKSKKICDVNKYV